MTARVEVLGVRHHGPGSARSVARALDELRPDVVVIEGAPELDAVVPLPADPDLRAAGRRARLRRRRAAPGAVLPVRRPSRPSGWRCAGRSSTASPSASPTCPRRTTSPTRPSAEEGDATTRVRPAAPTRSGRWRSAAGYDDPERWWEDAVEHRQHLLARALRRDPGGDGRGARERPRRRRPRRRRERATRGGDAPGAPRRDAGGRRASGSRSSAAPTTRPRSTRPPSRRQARDNELLERAAEGRRSPPPGRRGRRPAVVRERVRRRRDVARLVPAPLRSLGRGGRRGRRPSWLVRVARALRGEQLDASTGLGRRGRPGSPRRWPPSAAARRSDSPSSTTPPRPCSCEGSGVPLRARRPTRSSSATSSAACPETDPDGPARRRPRSAAAGAAAQARRDGARRSRSTCAARRQRARSVLLHRLRLLGVAVGHGGRRGPDDGHLQGGLGAEWHPELAVALIEASLYGTTVAAARRPRSPSTRGPRRRPRPRLGRSSSSACSPTCPTRCAAVVAALAERTARQHDTLALLGAVEPLARTCRYGDVRGVDIARRRAGARRPSSPGPRSACAPRAPASTTTPRAAMRDGRRGGAPRRRPGRRRRAARPVDAALGAVAARRPGPRRRSPAGSTGCCSTPACSTRPRPRPRLSRRLSVGRARRRRRRLARRLPGGRGGAAAPRPDAAARSSTSGSPASPTTTFEDLLPLLRRTFSRFEPAERRLDRHASSRGLGGGARDRGRRRRPLDLERGPPGGAPRSPPCSGWRWPMSAEERPRRATGSPAGASCSAAARPTASARAGPMASLSADDQQARRGPRARSTTATGAAGSGALGAPGRPLARRHPHLLPVVGRAGDAGRRDGPARPAPAAARARDAGGGAARHRPGQRRWSASAGSSPSASRETARAVVRGVTDELEERLRARDRAGRHRGAQPGGAHPAAPACATSTGGARSRRTSSTTSPSTARSCPSGSSATPGVRTSVERDIILCIDQSGSMAESVVYSSVFGAVLASLRSVADQPGRLRHRGRRPHRRARRPGRRALRRAARRRHRHQPGARLLPGPHRAARPTRSSC